MLAKLLTLLQNDSNNHRDLVLDLIAKENLLEQNVTSSDHIWFDTIQSLFTASNAADRVVAAKFVALSINQIPSICYDHASSWIQNLLVLVPKSNAGASYQAVVQSLVDVFILTADRPDIVHEVTSVHLPKFVPSIIVMLEKPNMIVRISAMSFVTCVRFLLRQF